METNFKKSSLMLLVILACLGFTSSIMDPFTEALIDQSIDTYFIKERHIPGFGLTIVQDGEIIYSKGHGHRNIEKNLPVTNKTLFGLGSVTKAITSTMAIKNLMEKFPELGGSVIDTPIWKLNPALNLTLMDRYRTENINFRDLFSHRHCMGQTGLSLLVGAIPNSQEFAYRQRYIGQTGYFRTGCFSYSNEVYGYAGEALAQVMNTTFAEMATKFMREIGMEDAFVVDAKGTYENNTELNQGYYWRPDLEVNHPFNITLWRKIHMAPGGGGIFASPRDLGEYLKFHLNGGRVGDKQIMTQDQLNIQLDVAERLGFGGDKNSETDQITGNLGYGLGITVSLVEGWKVYQHAGNFPPFRNKISFSPKQRLAMYTTSNSMSINEGDMDFAHLMVAELFRRDSSSKGYQDIPREIWNKMQAGQIKLPSSDFDSLLNLQETSYGAVPPVEDMMNNYKNKSFSDFALNETDIVGRYGHNVDGELEIYTAKNGTDNSTILSIAYGTDGLGTLEFLEGNFYKVNWTTDLLQQFWSDGGYREITFRVEFLVDQQIMNMFMDDWHVSSFKKGGLLDSAPASPWAPDSCSP